MCADIKELQTALFTSRSGDMTNMTHHRSCVEWSWAVQVDWPLTWLALLHSEHHIEYPNRSTLDLFSIYKLESWSPRIWWWHSVVALHCKNLQRNNARKEKGKHEITSFCHWADNESLYEHKQLGVARSRCSKTCCKLTCGGVGPSQDHIDTYNIRSTAMISDYTPTHNEHLRATART